MSDLSEDLDRVATLTKGHDLQWPYVSEVALKASATLKELEAEVTRLRALLVEERTDNLWNAYNTGLVRDGRWTHMFMSDGEWLAYECGLDPGKADYPDDVVQAAIPIAAGRALLEKTT